MSKTKTQDGKLPEGHLQIGIVGESPTKSTLKTLEEHGYLRRKDTTPLSKLSEKQAQTILDEYNDGKHQNPAGTNRDSNT